jgi:hypothetical protein
VHTQTSTRKHVWHRRLREGARCGHGAGGVRAVCHPLLRHAIQARGWVAFPGLRFLGYSPHLPLTYLTRTLAYCFLSCLLKVSQHLRRHRVRLARQAMAGRLVGDTHAENLADALQVACAATRSPNRAPPIHWRPVQTQATAGKALASASR